MKNILEFLESNAAKIPGNIAITDENGSLTYKQLHGLSSAVGSYIGRLGFHNRPVAVYTAKNRMTLAAMLGVVYSGNFYTVIDCEMPVERIIKVFSTLHPCAVLTDEEHYQSALELGSENVIILSKAAYETPDTVLLDSIRLRQIDTDPLYALYTSGSTGVPKGAVITHDNVIKYSEWAVNTFNFTEKTVFGNQTPFYFSMSVTEIYSSLRVGAAIAVIPKIYFTFPIKLIEFLNEKKVNTLYWVPSALGIISNFKLFSAAKPEYLKTVLFAGEVMPVRHLNYWIDNLPGDILYANLYGPTETTDICTYYVVNRRFADDEPLPIGAHCDNCDVFIVNSEGREAKAGEEGELFARGSFLSPGYYNNPAKTAEAFIQNPLNDSYPETVYKTGDLVRLNENGEIMYICRRDYQIKHMGYRIELGEIETAVTAIDRISSCACLYDEKNDHIVLVYSAKKLPEDELMNLLSAKLNSYLLPNRLVKMRELPINSNGKIDRKRLKEELLGS